jgi:hypothetical protein
MRGRHRRLRHKGRCGGAWRKVWSDNAPARVCRHALCSPKPPPEIHPPVWFDHHLGTFLVSAFACCSCLFLFQAGPSMVRLYHHSGCCDGLFCARWTPARWYSSGKSKYPPYACALKQCELSTALGDESCKSCDVHASVHGWTNKAMPVRLPPIGGGRLNSASNQGPQTAGPCCRYVQPALKRFTSPCMPNAALRMLATGWLILIYYMDEGPINKVADNIRLRRVGYQIRCSAT